MGASWSVIVAGDVVGVVAPLAVLMIVAAVSLVIGRNTAGDDGGVRDTSVFWGFYGALLLIGLMPLYLAGYAASRIITVASRASLAATVGYAGLVASLALAIFINKSAALILGALPATGALASAVAFVASGERRRRSTAGAAPPTTNE